MKNLLYTILSTSFLLVNYNQLIAQDFSGTNFRNGDPIPYIENAEEWVKAGENKQPAWCYLLNNAANGAIYGKLYNWYAVADPRGLCPIGWHVPSDKEWTILSKALGVTEAGKKMKSLSGWYKNGNGSNGSEFNGLPGGDRDVEGKSWGGNQLYGYWWSSSGGSNCSDCLPEYHKKFAWAHRLAYNWPDLNRHYYHKGQGFSVRCLKD
jgi:uncharacterized protein (TIGR02145 family)